MNDDPLDSLLERLNRGDDEAAERVFLDYQPYLRVVVRRRLTPALRAKFDSMDVIQSAWADVLRGFREAGWQFPDRDRLKAFLARVTYNHFVDTCRKHGPEVGRGRRLADEDPPASGWPRASEVAQADELWERMLELCPPDHRELLRLKKEGLPLAEIAARTGLHEGSVRRILYDLARRLSEKERALLAPGSKD
jgi:RNA polymerase sigma-70 factor (ECF subfamily)